jgi:glycerophosphoryl diester phosphodiesterase
MKKLLKRLGWIALFVLSALIVINIIPAKNVMPLNGFRKDGKNLIVATQSGISTDYPANIAASFNTASGLGIMYFSVGVVMTSDEVLIIADEDDLSYYTSETGKISEHTYDEIKSLNFAYQFQDSSGAYPYRASTLTCLTVSDFFDLFPYSNFIFTISQQEKRASRLRAAVRSAAPE